MQDDSSADNQREIENMKVEFAKFTSEIKSWMETTNEYRRSLCNKIDKLYEKLSELPCKERKGIYDNHSTQLALLWTLVIGIIMYFVAQGFAHNVK